MGFVYSRSSTVLIEEYIATLHFSLCHLQIVVVRNIFCLCEVEFRQAHDALCTYARNAFDIASYAALGPRSGFYFGQNRTQLSDLKSSGNLAEWRIFKGIREEGSGFAVHAEWLAAYGFCANGIEIHEPGFEDDAGNG